MNYYVNDRIEFGSNRNPATVKGQNTILNGNYFVKQFIERFSLFAPQSYLNLESRKIQIIKIENIVSNFKNGSYRWSLMILIDHVDFPFNAKLAIMLHDSLNWFNWFDQCNQIWILKSKDFKFFECFPQERYCFERCKKTITNRQRRIFGHKH